MNNCEVLSHRLGKIFTTFRNMRSSRGRNNEVMATICVQRQIKSFDNIANIHNRSSQPRLYLLNLRNKVCIMFRVRGCFLLPASGYFLHL